MQKYGVVDNLCDGYVLEVSNNVETLYLDKKEIKKVTIEDDKKTVEEDGVTTTYYGLSAPEKIVTKFNDYTLEERYEYSSSGVLKRKITLMDEAISSITNYNYSKDSALTAFFEDGNIFYTSSDTYSYSEGNQDSSIKIINNLMVKKSDDRAINSDSDKIVVRDKAEETIYALNGQVLKRTFFDNEQILSTTEYFYDGEKLIKELFKEGSKEVITEYKEKEKVITTYQDNELKSVRTINQDGIYEIVYRQNKAYAKVKYDVDSKRALEVKVLWKEAELFLDTFLLQVKKKNQGQLE